MPVAIYSLKQLAHCPNKRQHSPTNANILKLAVVGSSWYLSLECPVNQLPAPHCSDFFQLATYFFNCVLRWMRLIPRLTFVCQNIFGKQVICIEQ